jgi:hypothetical protein
MLIIINIEDANIEIFSVQYRNMGKLGCNFRGKNRRNFMG